jgi:serine/threonine protein phosphatase PrpC
MTTLGNEDTSEITISPEKTARLLGNDVPEVQVEFGGASDAGRVRTNNEDHYAVVRRYRSREVLLTNMPQDAYPPHTDNVYAMAVADGVGGAAFGELASELALRTGWELTGRAFKWGFSLSETESAEVIDGVKTFVQLIHQRIKAEANHVYKGMGTTLTGILAIGWDAFVVHVGDSRAYLNRNGVLYRLTHDQTLAELMVTSGMIASVDQAAMRFRNTLISCLGGNYAEVDVETTHLMLENGDQLLLCTDGLTDMVEESRIAELVNRTLPAQTICDDLIQAALAAGGRDNVTVVLGRFNA